MKASELESKLCPIGRQLYNLKRCFGSAATIGIVENPGCKVGYYRTLAELESAGHILPAYSHLDPYLAVVPSVYACPDENTELVINSSAEDPWSIAKRRQEEARERADHKRKITRHKK